MPEIRFPLKTRRTVGELTLDGFVAGSAQKLEAALAILQGSTSSTDTLCFGVDYFHQGRSADDQGYREALAFLVALAHYLEQQGVEIVVADDALARQVLDQQCQCLRCAPGSILRGLSRQPAEGMQ